MEIPVNCALLRRDRQLQKNALAITTNRLVGGGRSSGANLEHIGVRVEDRRDQLLLVQADRVGLGKKEN